MEEKDEDPVMKTLRKHAEGCGMTYQEMGEKMGYGPKVARQAVFQFLNSENPRIGMIRQFLKATGGKLKLTIE